mgnify:CR=1 FL=1
MMLRLTDIQDWISGLGVAPADHVYIGKLDNKQQNPLVFIVAADLDRPILLWVV